MPIDHAARSAQVARIIAHAGNANTNNGQLSWSAPGAASVVYFSAVITEDRRDPSEIDRDDSNENTVRVVAAASIFGTEFPRVGQSFKDTSGRSYRIIKVMSPPLSPTAAFRCAVAAPLSS